MTRLMLFALAVSLPLPGGAAEVRLKDEAVVAAPYFTLGDIAAVDVDGLRKLRIGRSPRAAGALSLRQADVQRVLLQLRPELQGTLKLAGAESTVVRRGPLQTLPFARVREAAGEALRGALSERYPRFEIEFAGEDRLISLPPGAPQLSVRLPALVPAPRKAVVWVDVHVDGRPYQAVPVPFELRAFAQAWISRRALRPGELVRPGDFDAREADVAGHAAPVSRLEMVRLKRRLAPGEVLTMDDVERVPVVMRDQEVRVRLAVGAVEVETTGIAARDAMAGEVIRVRNAASNQTFAARVTDRGLVEALWR